MKIHQAIQTDKHGEANRLCFAQQLLLTPGNNDYQNRTTILQIALTFLLDELSVQCLLDAPCSVLGRFEVLEALTIKVAV